MTFMSSDEFETWAAKPGRTAEEIRERATELEVQLHHELVESSGHTVAEYESSSQDRRDQMLEQGAEAWINQANQQEAADIAADEDGQREAQSQLCGLFSSIFPSETNGQLFAERYAEYWAEANPNLPIYWEIGAMKALAEAMIAAGEFPVTRVYKS